MTDGRPSDGKPRRSLPLVRDDAPPAPSERERPPVHLGVLSIHLESKPYPVGCEFCYLGQRHAPAAPPSSAAAPPSSAAAPPSSAAPSPSSAAPQQAHHRASPTEHAALQSQYAAPQHSAPREATVDARLVAAMQHAPAASPDEAGLASGESLARLVEAVEQLSYDELAVAVSEPAEPARAPLRAVVAAARRRGRPVTLTTTARVVATVPAICDGITRVNLSVDPRKGSVDPRQVERAVRWIRHDGSAREVVLIASLTTPAFAERLVGEGLLARYLATPGVDKVALNALKPPPAWCGRAFWLRTLARLAPLLREHLDRRLFLDCWVAARILHLGPCPARPDLSPTANATEFRSCVYAPRPDATAATTPSLQQALTATYAPPAVCPFPIPP